MESVPLLEKVYEDAKKVFGASHLKTAEAASVLGTFYFFIGQSQSEPLLHEAIEIYASHVDNNHPAVLNVKSKLGQLLVNFGRFDEAETLLRENMLELSESWDADSVYRIETVGSLAYALMMQGKFEEGNPLLQEVIDALLNPEQGEMNPAVGRLRFIRAHAYILHHHPEADKTVDEFIASWTETFGPNDVQLLLFTQLFCKSYFDVDEPDRGIEVATHLFVQIREYEDSNAKDLLNILKMESGLAALCVKAHKSDEALELLGRIIPQLQKEWEPTFETMVEMEMLRAKAISQLGRGEESIVLFAQLHGRLIDALGSQDATTLMVEVGRINNLVSLERWDEIDVLMDDRLSRRSDDADLLLKMANVIINNGHQGYRKHYLDVALQATQRAVSIRGEDDPETTYMFARVYLALGEQEEALNWLAKAIAFAGEEHEHIDTYREKLEEVTAKMKEPVDQ
jgi:tetratricopeptide (TPR) repeat protein